MLQFRVLGSLDLRGEEGEEILSVLSQPKRIALLSYLAVATPRGFHRRDKLVGLLWPDLDQDRARAALRKSLHHLRQSLGEEAVLGRGDEEVSLNWDLFQLDIGGFEESLEERPEEALDLYRGHLLDGFYLAGCPEFDRWAEGERERLRKAAAGAAWTVAHRLVAAGLPVDGERMGQRALDLAPTDEGEVRRFIGALAKAGDRAGAVSFYEKFAERLHEELELRPDAESRELVGKIRDSILLPDPQEKGREAPESPPKPDAAPPPPTVESLGGDPGVADPAALFERFKSSIADRYEIGREIGRGGMATVYLAKDLKHDRPVALKVMRPELSAILGGERFLREIRIAAKLNHPHILVLHDSGSADGVLYYVMPYVEGESLRAKLDRERELSVDEAVTIARQVGSALDHAHEKGIVHRDIKPENILIHQGEALVSDFGIAVAVSAAGGTRLTDTGLSLGTPEYMSPEQATGEREVDARSDLYSLGAVLYEMLVGEPPHTGNTVQSIIAKVVSAEPQPVSRVRQSVPSNVDAAVMCAVAKTPADRFSSGADFSAALTDPGFALPSPTDTLGGATHDGPWRILTIVLGSIAILATMVLISIWFRPPPEMPQPPVRATLPIPLGEEIAWRGGRNIALSPNGDRLVYVGHSDVGFQLWLRPLDEPQAAPIPGTGAGRVPFFSPDGQHIAFFRSPDYSLWVISTTSSERTELVDSVGPLAGDWGPDGFVYFAAPGGGISRIPESGGDIEPVTILDTPRGERGHTTVDVLPNGKGALITIWLGSGDTEIAVVDFETGIPRVLDRGSHPQYAASGHVVYAREDGALLAARFDQDEMESTGPRTLLSEEVVVYGQGACEFSLAESGTLLRIEEDDIRMQPVWIDREGSFEPVDSDWAGNFLFPALSPDGSQIALSVGPPGDRHIRTKPVPAGMETQLTLEGYLDQPPVWFPDSERVLYRSGRESNSGLWETQVGRPGTETLILPEDSTGSFAAPTWSHDGRWLVYQRGWWENGDILGLRPGVDSQPVDLVVTDYHERNPALSPDGDWLAYESDRSGRPEVYVTPFPNVEDIPQKVSTAGGRQPRWAHNGHELFYLSPGDELVAVEYSTEPSFRALTERPLFSVVEYKDWRINHSYSVGNEDERFLFLRQLEGGVRNLALTINFFEELKEKVGG